MSLVTSSEQSLPDRGYYKLYQQMPVYLQMTFPKLGVVEIGTQRHFRPHR